MSQLVYWDGCAPLLQDLQGRNQLYRRRPFTEYPSCLAVVNRHGIPTVQGYRPGHRLTVVDNGCEVHKGSPLLRILQAYYLNQPVIYQGGQLHEAHFLRVAGRSRIPDVQRLLFKDIVDDAHPPGYRQNDLPQAAGGVTVEQTTGVQEKSVGVSLRNAHLSLPSGPGDAAGQINGDCRQFPFMQKVQGMGQGLDRLSGRETVLSKQAAQLAFGEVLLCISLNRQVLIA
jgi:hypothetical protein